MSFGNKGGGCKTGRKYAQQITVGLTEEHFEFLRQHSKLSLADALRNCVEACMKKEPGTAEAGRVKFVQQGETPPLGYQRPL